MKYLVLCHTAVHHFVGLPHSNLTVSCLPFPHGLVPPTKQLTSCCLWLFAETPLWLLWLLPGLLWSGWALTLGAGAAPACIPSLDPWMPGPSFWSVTLWLTTFLKLYVPWYSAQLIPLYGNVLFYSLPLQGQHFHIWFKCTYYRKSVWSSKESFD